MYTVTEGDGLVEVCVNLTSPEGGIGNENLMVPVEVNNNEDPGSIPPNVTSASKCYLTVTTYLVNNHMIDDTNSFICE